MAPAPLEASSLRKAMALLAAARSVVTTAGPHGFNVSVVKTATDSRKTWQSKHS